MSLSQKVLHTLQQILNTTKNSSIPLHEPSFSGNEWKYTKECLDTGWVSSVGKYVDEFELKLTEFTGVKHAIAVVNGTAALHICLKLIDVQPGDEVLVPTLTFIATANAISYCGAIPHFVDSDIEILGIASEKLNIYLKQISEVRNQECFNRLTGHRIKALIPMHTFGHPVDLDALISICHKFHLDLVEDAAESLGSYYKGIHTGNWGKTSALSFNGNKIMTTGGGGAILTNDSTLAQRAKHITTTAKRPHSWNFSHDEVGYNYRLPNINAALGCAQLEQLPQFLEQKRQLAKQYQKVFSEIEGIHFFTETSFARSNYWLNTLLLDEQHASQRNEILQITNDNGIMTRPVWSLLHKTPMFQKCPRMDLKTAEQLEQCLINIPSSPNLLT